MAGMAAETVGENIVNKIHHKHWSAFCCLFIYYETNCTVPYTPNTYSWCWLFAWLYCRRFATGPNLNSKLRVGYQFNKEKTSECLSISCARKAGKIPRTINGRIIRVEYTVTRTGRWLLRVYKPCEILTYLFL